MTEEEAKLKSRWYAQRQCIAPSAVLDFSEGSPKTEPLPEEEVVRIRAEMEKDFQEGVGKLYVATPGANLAPWGTNGTNSHNSHSIGLIPYFMEAAHLSVEVMKANIDTTLAMEAKNYLRTFFNKFQNKLEECNP